MTQWRIPRIKEVTSKKAHFDLRVCWKGRFSNWSTFEETHFLMWRFRSDYFELTNFSKWLFSEKHSFLKWPIFGVIDYKVSHFSKWFNSEVTHFANCPIFRSDSFCELSHFSKCVISKIPIFEVTNLILAKISKWLFFRSDSFPKWPISRWWI